MSRSSDYLEDLRNLYGSYAEIFVAELAQIEAYTNELEKVRDPAWLAFRENPVTQKLYQHCIASFRACYLQLANDDGKLEQIERAKLDLGKKWSLWFLRSLGGDPEKLKQRTEQEIERMADAAGLINSPEG